MSAFDRAVRQFSLKFDAWSNATYVNTVSAVLGSIKFGSPVTGAPGQPVQTGRLRGSWIPNLESESSVLISTKVIYAPFIESGVSWRGKPMTLRSQVGGWHSVALTAINFDRLVAAVVNGTWRMPSE